MKTDITRLDAHHKLYLSLITAFLCLLIVQARVSPSVQFILAWITFTLTQTSLSLATALAVHPIEMKQITKLQDSNRTLIFIFVLFSALISLFVVILLLRSAKQLSGLDLNLHVLLSIAAVMCSWVLVHMIFTFRYAHLYYDLSGVKESSAKYVRGLEFPGEDKPDYLDFAYFSFVIGMTFQVSDVEISSKRIRRLTLMHSLISFVFNTVIVALSINIISGLTQK
jgi:uncharacterized membrane protein